MVPGHTHPRYAASSWPIFGTLAAERQSHSLPSKSVSGEESMQNPQSRAPFILVVEDDSKVAGLLKEILGDAYSVECVSDAPAAFSALQRRLPDLVLLDCLLPGDGSGDVTEVAKSCQRQVVLMSGLPEVLAGLAAFGYPCLQKPFKVTELLQAIESALPRQGGAAL